MDESAVSERRRTRWLLLDIVLSFTIAGLLLLITLVSVLNVNWTSHILDQGPISNDSVSIATDSAGKIHIVWGDSLSGVIYTTNAGGSWTDEVLSEDHTSSTSIAVDSNGGVHIIYAASIGSNDTLRYLEKAPGGWNSQIIDTNLSTPNAHCSIAVDSSAVSHVTYTMESTGRLWLMYANNSGGSWNVSEALAFSISSYETWTSNIVLSSDGLPRIAYVADKAVVGVASMAPDGTWNDQRLFYWDLTGDSAGIAADGLDRLHVCYWGTVLGSTDYGLVYALGVPNGPVFGWSFSLVAALGGSNRGANLIAVDSVNQPHIAYTFGKDVHYVVNTSAGWQPDTLRGQYDGNDAYGGLSSMALDSGGHAYVALYGPMLKFLTDRLNFSDQFNELRPYSTIAAVLFILLFLVGAVSLFRYLRSG